MRVTHNGKVMSGSIGMRIMLCILTLCARNVGAAQGPACVPCESHCDMIGSEANANCVKSGIDPVVCGPPHLAANPLDIMAAPQVSAAAGSNVKCTSQGICYKAGITAKARCMASCFICTPSTVHPDFLLISILYAPPGNASTASFGQSSSSGVVYSISNNISETSGTAVGITESFASESGGFGGGFILNLQSNSSTGSGSSDQFSAVTTSTSTENLRPGKDPIDHMQDIFLVWLNPVVTITKSDQRTLAAAISAGEAQMSVQAVSANQLINGIPPEKLAPTKICPTKDTCYTLPGLGSLTQDDIKAILAQDPFLGPSPTHTPDPSRYLYIQSNPLENTSVAANVTQTFTVSDAQTATHTKSETSTSSDTVTSGISIKAGPIGISLTDPDTWTWTHTVSQGISNGHTQQASVTLASTTNSCCGVDNTVTCEVSIWEDMVYRTFVFVPQPETCQSSLLAGPQVPAVAPNAAQPGLAAHLVKPAEAPLRSGLRGSVLRGGQAVSGATVVVSGGNGEVLLRVVTDHLGRYFSSRLVPGKVNVRVGPKVLQTTVKSGEETVLDVSLQ